MGAIPIQTTTSYIGKELSLISIAMETLIECFSYFNVYKSSVYLIMSNYNNRKECLFQHLLGHYLIAQASETLPQWLSMLAKWEILKWIDQKVPLQKSYQALSLAFIPDGTSVG